MTNTFLDKYLSVTKEDIRRCSKIPNARSTCYFTLSTRRRKIISHYENIKYTLLLALIRFIGWNQVDRSIIPSAGEAKEIKLKDSEVFKTENGITVIPQKIIKYPVFQSTIFRERTIKLKMIKLVYPLCWRTHNVKIPRLIQGRSGQ